MLRLALKKSLQKNRSLSIKGNRSISSDGIPIQQAGFGKILFLLTPMAAGAGVVAYAKHDNQFRKTLVQNVPGIDPVLKVLLQEEGNALDEVGKSLERTTQKVSDIKDTITGFFGDSSKTPEKSKIETPSLSFVAPSKPKEKPAASANVTTKSDSSVPAPPIEKPSPSAATTTTAASKSNAAQVKPASPPAKVEAKPAAPVVLSPPTPLPKNITELQQALDVAARTAAQEYENAIKVLKVYNEDIKKTLDEATEHLDPKIWNTLKNKTSARDTAVEAAEVAAQSARSTIEKLEKSLRNISDASEEQVVQIRDTVRNFANKLNSAKDALYDAKDSAQLTEKYWKNVESARNYFVNEMEAIFPGINLTEKKLKLSADDLDLFILYAHSHILAYQRELQKLQIEGETRLQRAIETLRGDDQTEAIKNQLEFHLEKEKQNLSVENQKKLFKIQVETEKRLREQLKLQSEAHSDHLEDALKQKEQELRRVFNRELSEKLSNEQTAYKVQLAAMLGKMKGMDTALKARADVERQAHQAQSLWNASQAMWSTVRQGKSGSTAPERLCPLENAVDTVKKAAEGDELVSAVLKAVPEVARKRGVYSEEALRERYFKVDKLARQLALVPEKGAILPMYFLSYLQSIFILTPSEPITKNELNNEPFDFTQLDTFDVLNRAKYWMERGNLVQTVKYLNLLKGAPRKVAKDWLQEARLLLETQQATNVLMAHAATSGVTYS